LKIQNNYLANRKPKLSLQSKVLNLRTLRERQAIEFLVELKPMLEEIRDFIEIPDNDECWGFPSVDQILVWTEECVRGKLMDARIGNVSNYILDTLNYNCRKLLNNVT
jgi:hypothetical protein